MKICPKRILWPTDFSRLSMKAAEYAAAFRAAFGAELHVINVCMPIVSPNMAIPYAPEIELSVSEAELMADAKARLQQMARDLFGDKPAVVCEALVGTPWAGICNYANRVGIDLIVVATHGLTGLRHVLIGSTAERVVQHATCPVLTVKNSERDIAAT